MSSDELIKINVAIAGRKYPLKVQKDEEQFVKTIEKEINTKISEMRRSYGMEELDHVSMALLSFVYETRKNKGNIENSIEDSIDQISSIIKSSL